MIYEGVDRWNSPYLIHYGVKGMKWGVRHDRERSGDRQKSFSNTPKRKMSTAKKVAIGVMVAAGAIAAAYAVKAIGDKAITDNFLIATQGRGASDMAYSYIDEYGSQLNPKDLVIPKGTKLQRIVKAKNIEELNKLESAKDIAYATYDKNDNNIYKAYFGQVHKGQYVTKLKATNELKSPSERKRLMAFMGLMTNPSFRQQFEKDFDTKVDTKNTAQYYSPFFEKLGSSSIKSREMYFKKVRDMGYNILVDDNDVGYLGKTPIILLDRHNDSVITGKKKMNYITRALAIMKADIPKTKHNVRWYPSKKNSL